MEMFTENGSNFYRGNFMRSSWILIPTGVLVRVYNSAIQNTGSSVLGRRRGRVSKPPSARGRRRDHNGGHPNTGRGTVQVDLEDLPSDLVSVAGLERAVVRLHTAWTYHHGSAG